MDKTCENCKYVYCDRGSHPCGKCIRRSEREIDKSDNWQPRQPEAVDASHLLKAAIDISIAELDVRLTALEAEVKRLRERKACPTCGGVGRRMEYAIRAGTMVTCFMCNGTGYIEPEVK